MNRFQNVKQVCPPELEIKKENDINTERSFVDLDIKIKDNTFSITLHDK